MKKVLQGGSTEITSMKQAEEILSSSPEQEERGDEKESDGAAPVVVVGYFKNGFEAKEYKAFKKRKIKEWKRCFSDLKILFFKILINAYFSNLFLLSLSPFYLLQWQW